MASNVIFFTTTGNQSYVTPADFVSFISVEAIGSGSGGRRFGAAAAGGGGGAYSKSTSVTGMSVGSTSYIQVGVGGTNANAGAVSWFNAASNANPTLSSQGTRADGASAPSSGVGGAGGTVANSIGDVRFAGGTGGNATSANGGGGGAGGPGGNGGNGVAGGSVVFGGGGSGATLTAAGSAGSSSTGGASSGQTGGTSPSGAGTNGGGGGGGGAGSTPGGNGGAGTSTFLSTANVSAGPGGGGGGGNNATGAAGGLYGGGGGGANASATQNNGANGIVILTYATAPVTRYWVGGTGTWDTLTKTNWSTTSGGDGGASAPAFNDNVIIDASSGTGTITITGGVCNDLTVTASQAIILGAAGSTLSVFGNLSFPSGGSFDVNTTLTFAATSTGKTITSNGKTLGDTTFKGAGGGWTLQDDLTYGSARTLTLTEGSFNANNFNVTGGNFASSNSNTRSLTMGSGTWTLAASSTSWNIGTTTGLTFNANTSTIALSDTSTSNKTFAGGGLTYYNLSISAATGIAAYIFTGANTFNQISSSKTVAYTITLPSSTTTTVTTWSATGSLGNLLTLKSSTSGTVATLAVTNPFTINYGTIQDVNLSAALIGTATNSTVINSNNWQVATTSTRWLKPLVTAGTGTITTPSDWPTTAISNIYVLGGGGGGAGNVTSLIAGGAGGGGGGYAKLTNTTLAASTSYNYTVGNGGDGSAGGATNQTGNTGGTSGWGGTRNTITYVSSADTSQNTSSTTITVNVPSGTANGDLMLMIVGTGGNSTNTWTTPLGWNIGTAGSQGRALFWRTASSEPGNYTVTQSASSTSNAFILTFRNAVFDTSGLAGQSAVTSPTPVAITVAVANSTIVYVAQSNLGTNITYTTPTGYNARASDSGATEPSAAIFSLAGVGSGSYSAPSITGSGAQSRAYVISLAPTLSSYTASASGGAGGTSTTTPTSTGGAGGTGLVGTTFYTGGTGGAGRTSSAGSRAGGGGGGAAGPNGNGGTGGVGFGGTGSAGSGGGGGGNGGGTAGADGTASIGGAGGNNSLGTGGGEQNSAGTLGGGGGGGRDGSNAGSGGAGIDIIVDLYGGGGGAGGGGDGLAGRSGGLYGGGGSGASTTGGTARAGGTGAQGAIFISSPGTYVPSTGNMFLMF
jgi:hypothetical protein